LDQNGIDVAKSPKLVLAGNMENIPWVITYGFIAAEKVHDLFCNDEILGADEIVVGLSPGRDSILYNRGVPGGIRFVVHRNERDTKCKNLEAEKQYENKTFAKHKTPCYLKFKKFFFYKLYGSQEG
jgi:hypothetical protein